ncbi:YcxB family protein [Aquirufa regiilacus]|jgi:hypothetical protein|uniref:YcxB family protein n=1 Tax=Aquirufa regiilacus TaxID=3024868 RepID=A0ABU3TUB8_9BACT|nr:MULTISPECIES: YcxB family protein [unclassified Aquirufa]MDT8887544.1 YcxB family protein [Aquirufa sp. LEPPI-3A]MDU0809444.1 YcxB family protein [Aquirufa sp. LEOWEIH-7C]
MAKNYGAQQRAQMQAPSNPLAIKTKKYGLEKNKYIAMCMRQLFANQWKWAFLPLALVGLNVFLNLSGTYKNYWIYIFLAIGVIGYILFWLIQFTGITQLAQYKQLFDKYRYEIDSRQIFMKISDKEGGVIKWDMILSAYKDKEAYVLEMGKYQFIYLPLAIFNNDNDRKLMDKIMRDKGLIN